MIKTLSTKHFKTRFDNLTYHFRSSRPEVFRKKGAVRNFAKFTGKHLRQSLFFNKVAGLRPKFHKRINKKQYSSNLNSKNITDTKKFWLTVKPLSKTANTITLHTAQKMMFSIKDFFSKCDQIRSFLRPHLLKKSLMENLIFCAVRVIE